MWRVARERVEICERKCGDLVRERVESGERTCGEW